MPLRVSGKNINVGMALRDRIAGRVAEATAKYFRGGFWATPSSIATALVSLPNACCICIRVLQLEAEGTATNAYESADQAALRIETASPLQAAPTGPSSFAERVKASKCRKSAKIALDSGH